MKDIKWVSSPNFDNGRKGKTIDKIVCHWMVGTLAGTDAHFKKASSKVSAHYGVAGKEVHQYVLEDDTAWHAGNYDMNLRSLGIEHEGGPDSPISEETYNTSAQLISELSVKYKIPLDRKHILKHSEIVATQCPGTLDVDRLIAMAKEFINNDDPCEAIKKDRDYQEAEKKKYKDRLSEKKALEDKLGTYEGYYQAQIDALEKKLQVEIDLNAKFLSTITKKDEEIFQLNVKLKAANDKKNIYSFTWIERFKSLFRG